MSSQLSSALTGAALEPASWVRALEVIADATRSDRAQLIGFGKGYTIDFNWASGPANGIIEHFAAIPPQLNFRIAASERFGNEAVLHEAHYDAVMGELPDPTYIEACREWGILFGCQTVLRDDFNGLIGLALLRSEQTGRTDNAEREAFDRIRREAAAAVSLQVAIERQGYKLIAGAYEAMSSACFVLDRSMRIGAMTPLAEAALLDGTITREDGRLASPLDRTGVLGLANRAMLTQAARRVILVDPQGPPVSVQFHRLPAREWSFGFEPYAVAVLTRAGAAPALDPTALRTAFGLTGAEAEIAMMLREGLDREAIRAARSISRETLRSHMAAIYAKLGVASEVETVRLLERLR